MPFNGSGGTSQPAGGIYPAAPNTLIESGKFNISIADVYSMLGTALLKDGQQVATARIPFASGISTDTILEKTTNTGVTVDGVLLKDSQVSTDQINEKTPAAGVTIDSVLLKDGGATLPGADLLVSRANVGGNVIVDVQNSDNTSVASSALLRIQSGGASSGDAVLQYGVVASNFVTGIDNSDSDKWKLCIGSAMGSGDAVVLTTAGEMTRPMQPAFLAYLSSTQSNVTGDATVYTVLFDVEIFDQGSDYSNPTFTAPVTGRYRFSAAVELSDMVDATFNGITMKLVTSNRTYTLALVNDVTANQNTARWVMNGSVLADMDAADTATVTIEVIGGTKTADVIGNAAGTAPSTYFCGELVC